MERDEIMEILNERIPPMSKVDLATKIAFTFFTVCVGVFGTVSAGRELQRDLKTLKAFED